MNSLPAPLRPEIDALETSRIQQVFDLGLGREGLIALWVGEGDQPTPAFICDAATEAMKAGKTFYTYKHGIPELRAAIAGYTRGLYDIDCAEERVSVTCSAMSGIMMVLQAVVGPGDNVVVVTPVWPNIMSAIQIAGGVVRAVQLDDLPDGGFRLDLDRLAGALDERTRAIFIASPGNPTGWIMSTEEQSVVLEMCRDRGIWMIADEVYARFIFDGAGTGGPETGRKAAPSFLEISAPEDPLIVVNSFSKAWAMTGWRMGWLTTPPSFIETLGRLIEFNTSGAPHFQQYACLAAIRDGEDYVRETVERCHRGGELVFQRLAALPRVHMARPMGAFYAFFRVEGLSDSLAYAKQILEETNVGLSPGSAFGPGGEGHMRLCFASSTARLSEALDRLEPVLSKPV